MSVMIASQQVRVVLPFSRPLSHVPFPFLHSWCTLMGCLACCHESKPDWVSAVAGAGAGLETFVTGCYDGCLRVYGPGCKVSAVVVLFSEVYKYRYTRNGMWHVLVFLS